MRCATGRRTSAAASNTQSYTLPPGKYEAAIALNRQLDALHFAGALWVLAVLWILARRWHPQRWFAVPAVIAVPWLVSFPLSIYRHHLGLSYGLSVEAWGPWLGDWLQGGLIKPSLLYRANTEQKLQAIWKMLTTDANLQLVQKRVLMTVSMPDVLLLLDELAARMRHA